MNHLKDNNKTYINSLMKELNVYIHVNPNEQYQQLNGYLYNI